MCENLILCLCVVVLLSCDVPEKQPVDMPIDSISVPTNPDSLGFVADSTPVDIDTLMPLSPAGSIKTGNTDPETLLAFSKTLKGVPYKYASTDPRVGFDCSGFITYVFNHFGVEVPRTSVDFTDEGTTVDLSSSKPGDLILFTGTDSTIRVVGHMGIITHTGDSIVFIHSTSGKANGVTETTLNPYYMGRFMKVIRVF